MGPRRLALVFMLVVALAGCAGPAPRLVSVEGTATAGGTRVLATVTNDGSGEGEIQVTVRLRSRDNVIEKQEKLELGPHQKKQVVTEFPVPPDGYVPEAEVEYPIR